VNIEGKPARIHILAPKHSSPVMGATAGLHDHTRRRPIRKERYQLRAFKRLVMNEAGLRINVVDLEDALGQIDCNGRGLDSSLVDVVPETALSHDPFARLRRQMCR